jgi:hypothetical protein
LNNYSTLPPQPSAVPEPSTLVLVGLGVLGLVVLRKRYDSPRMTRMTRIHTDCVQMVCSFPNG